MNIRARDFLLLTALACLAGCWPSLEDRSHEPAKSTASESPEISFLYPTRSFADRIIPLQIGASSAIFDRSSIVEFDDPSIVAEVVSVEPANLRLKVTVGPGASLGQHAIRISGDRGVVLKRDALQISPSLMFSDQAVKANLKHGGLADISVTNLDYLENPFNPGLVNVAFGPRMLKVNGVSSNRYSFLGILDISPKEQYLHMILRSTNPLGYSVSYSLPPGEDPIKIRAATITDLNLGRTISSQLLSAPYSSLVYRVDGSNEDAVLHFAFSNVGATLRDVGPTIAIAPSNGKFLEGQIIANSSGNSNLLNSITVLPATSDIFFSVFSSDFNGGSSGYEFDLVVTRHPVIAVDLTEPPVPDSPMMPIADIPLSESVSGNGKLEPASDNDFIRYVPQKSGKILAQALGSPILAVRVAHMEGDCVTPRVGVPIRPFQQESEVIGGRPYCVRLSSNTPTTYRLILKLTPN